MGQKLSAVVNEIKPDETKTFICTKCGEKKSADLFYKYQLRAENPVCRACLKTARKKIKAKIDVVVPSGRMSGLYIVSTLDRIAANTFKVGKHTGTQRKLISRYRTYLVDPIILFYHPDSSDKIDLLERSVLEQLTHARISDEDGRTTEWIRAPLFEIIETVFRILL